MLDHNEGGRGGGGNRARLIGGGVAVLLVLFVLVQNSDQVTIKLLTFSFSLPLWLALGIMALLGAAAGQAIGMWRGRRRKG